MNKESVSVVINSLWRRLLINICLRRRTLRDDRLNDLSDTRAINYLLVLTALCHSS